MQQTSPFSAGAIWSPEVSPSALPWQELAVTFGFFTVGIATQEQCPCDPRCLVRQRHGDDFRALAFEEAHCPLLSRIDLSCVTQDRSCSGDEKPSQLAAVLLGEPRDPVLPAAAVRRRGEAEPFCELTA